MKKQTRDREIKALLDSGMVREVLALKSNSNAQIILLNDGKTYIELEEQDYHSFHDCASSARHIQVRQDALIWTNYLNTMYPAKSLI